MQEPQPASAPAEQKYKLSFRKSLEAVKTAVPLEAYAGEHANMEPFGSGGWFMGRCPLPAHEDRTPSFYIYPDGDRGHSARAHCYGCGFHGDVLDLCQAIEGHAELWSAMISLSQRYGVSLPKRPDRWHSWNGEKARRRKAVRDALARSYQRRFFRLLGGYLEAIEDPAEREREGRQLWRDLWPVAVGCAEKRMAA